MRPSFDGFTSSVLGLQAGWVCQVAPVQQASGRRWGVPVGRASAAGRAVGTAEVADTVGAAGIAGAEHTAARTAVQQAARIGPSASAINLQP